jgi:chromosome condensin MukBEF ATPase and DNA-binding subunit MukB
MQEFRDQSAKLAAQVTPQAQATVVDTLASLNVVLSNLLRDVQQVQVRVGTVASAAAGQAAEEVTARLQPLLARVDVVSSQVTSLASEVQQLKARLDDVERHMTDADSQRQRILNAVEKEHES